jgi:hypothetical protein
MVLWCYQVLLFPIGIGFSIFGAGYVGVRLGKVRNGVAGAVAAVLGGVVAILTLHYCVFLRAVDDAPDLLPEERTLLKLSPGDFIRFMDARAQDGVRLSAILSMPSDQTRKDLGLNLGYTGSYVFWLVELLIVIVIGLLALSWPPRRHSVADARAGKRCTNSGL